MDDDIKPLLDKINSRKEFKTTSSCSGRIVLIKGRGEKGRAEWLFKSHKRVKAGDAWDALQKAEGRVWLLQEPLIVHVKCSSLEACQKLMNICNKAGLKHSGIVSAKTFMVEVRGSERVETVIDKGLIRKDYFNVLIEEANKSLEKAKEKIENLIGYF